MAFSGAAVAYCAFGGLILFSGIKGATISDTIKAAFKGNLNVTSTQAVVTPAQQAANSGQPSAGSTSTATSGSENANLLTAAKYLVSNGYSKAAAAGIAGCIAGESAGDPEAVGDQGTSFGLIQEHGNYSYLVTGNATKDLQSQLQAIIAYNNAQGAGLIHMLNSITDPVAASDFYSENFERPLVKDSDVRASVATSVYGQL